MKILSLFDGMACGMIAMLENNIQVDRYVAYEIDKYAVKTSSHNFPMIEHKGDVFEADFSEFKDFDFLVGGSPCTYWSIAQTKNRETVASGMGWELFSQYVRALKEAKPKYFIYENNKSMSSAIRESITETFGFEPICINSALVSAQNRQRLYWVGIRRKDGTYQRADLIQPEDRGILLKDILETTAIPYQEKADVLTASYNGAVIWNSLERHQRSMVAEPVNVNENWKSHTLKAQYYKNGTANFITNGDFGASAVAEPIPKCIAQRGRYFDNPKLREIGLPTEQMYEARDDEKTNTLTTVQKDNMVAEPLSECFRVKEATKKGYTDIEPGECVDLSMPNSKTRRGRKMDAKSNCLQTSCQFHQYCGIVNTPIYKVENGMITVKGKQYPIKLVDEYYIIRKLSVTECMRLQTIPSWYDFSCVSNSQAYKMLGNGWTVDVIRHLIDCALNTEVPETVEPETFFDYEQKYYE